MLWPQDLTPDSALRLGVNFVSFSAFLSVTGLGEMISLLVLGLFILSVLVPSFSRA